MGADKTELLDAILKMLNINFLDKKIDTSNLNLSLEEQQKVSLARVLLQESKVLILDEPLSNLDTDSAKMFIN